MRIDRRDLRPSICTPRVPLLRQDEREGARTDPRDLPDLRDLCDQRQRRDLRPSRRRLAPALLAVLAIACGCGTPSAAPTAGAGRTAASPSAAAQASSQGASSSGPSAGGAARPAGQQPLTRLSFETSWIPNANQLPWYYAEEHGDFRRAGLDVKISNGKGSGIAVEQVASKNADLGQADLTTMALERAHGAPVKAIYVEFARTPYGLLTAASEHITTYARLKGRKIVDVASSAGSYLLPAALKQAGLSTGDVRLLNTSPATQNSTYIAGKADAVVLDLPVNGPLISPKRASDEIDFGSSLDVPSYGLLAREDYLRAHPAAVRAFLQVTSQALQRLLTDKQAVQDAAQYVASHNTDVHASLLVESWNRYEPFVRSPDQKGHPLGWMPPAMWQQTVAVLERYAGLKGDPRPDDEYTNEFVPASAT